MENKSQKIVIIGGVAGGATSAARARRVNENAEITMIEMGKYVSFANCGLPYYIAGDIKDRNKLLLQSPSGFLERYNINVLVETEAIEVNRQEKYVLIQKQGKQEKLPYDKLILSQGGRPIVPEVPGVHSDFVFILRDIDDMDSIHDFINHKSPKNAVIVGGGFIGLEMAEALNKRGLKVRIIEKADQVMINQDIEFSEMIKRHLQEHQIDVFLKTSIVSIQPENHKAILEDGTAIEADIILFSIGVKPELNLAKKSGLEIGETGGVKVNDYLQSSDPDIYVVGDMAEITNRVSGKKVRIPLAGPANRQGRIAGTNAGVGNIAKYNGSLGSSIAKVCDMTVAATGLSEKVLKSSGVEYHAVTIHGNHHAGYYPGAKQLTLKVLYSPKDGRIFGAQAFGAEGVDKRIDVIATAILGNLTIFDLEEIDLAYAPPYSSANDPVNMASFVAENNIKGFSPSISAEEFLKEKEKAIILDVRNPDEFSRGHVPGAINIPLPKLRKELEKLDKSKSYLVHCQVGYRGHLATRILIQNGISNVKNVSGGYKSIEILIKK